MRRNLIAWLTTVRPDGSQSPSPSGSCCATTRRSSTQAKDKLRNVAANSEDDCAIDVTDIERETSCAWRAPPAPDQPPANEHPAYLVKYTERLGALFGTPEQFATLWPRSSSRRATP